MCVDIFELLKISEGSMNPKELIDNVVESIESLV